MDIVNYLQLLFCPHMPSAEASPSPVQSSRPASAVIRQLTHLEQDLLAGYHLVFCELTS